MSDQAQNEDYLNLLDKRTQRLKIRITVLKELITTMVEEDKETKRQSEILVEMLKLLNIMKAFEIAALIRLSRYDSLSRSLPPSIPD